MKSLRVGLLLLAGGGAVAVFKRRSRTHLKTPAASRTRADYLPVQGVGWEDDRDVTRVDPRTQTLVGPR